MGGCTRELRGGRIRWIFLTPRGANFDVSRGGFPRLEGWISTSRGAYFDASRSVFRRLEDGLSREDEKEDDWRRTWVRLVADVGTGPGERARGRGGGGNGVEVEVGMQWREGAVALRISSRTGRGRSGISSRTGRGHGDACEERTGRGDGDAYEERKHASSGRGAYEFGKGLVKGHVRAREGAHASSGRGACELGTRKLDTSPSGLHLLPSAHP